MRRLFQRFRAAFLPFHYPGRDRRFLSALPPGVVRRYNLMWLGRGASWARVAVLVVIAAGTVVVANGHADPLSWVVVGNAAVLLPAWLVVNHFESRVRERLIERDFPQRCRTCGYDLRASPDRCPECGARPPIGRRAATV